MKKLNIEVVVDDDLTSCRVKINGNTSYFAVLSLIDDLIKVLMNQTNDNYKTIIKDIKEFHENEGREE